MEPMSLTAESELLKYLGSYLCTQNKTSILTELTFVNSSQIASLPYPIFFD